MSPLSSVFTSMVHRRPRSVWMQLGVVFALAFTACADAKYGAAGRDAALDPDGPQSAGDSATSDAGGVDARTQSPTSALAQDATSADNSDPDASGADVQRGLDAESPTTVEDSSTEPLPPTSAPDAGPLDDAGPVAALPSWAPSLVGRFAVQIVAFSEDTNGLSTLRSRMLVDARQLGSEVELLSQECELNDVSALGKVAFAHPERLPPRRQRVIFDATSFSTEAIDKAVGFEASPPPACAGMPGAAIAKRVEQTWISGTTCRCPGDNLPSINDCRVIDADGDELPGYSAVGNVVGLADSRVYGVTWTLSRYLQGRPGEAGGFTALYERNETSLQYGCRPSTCANLSGSVVACTPESSSVVFVPLAGRTEPRGGWDCSTMLARAGELFPVAAPAPPTVCRH